MQYFVYITKDARSRLYIGVTSNLASRLRRHNLGQGAKYTAKTKSFKIVYNELHHDLQSARARENQIKRWSRAKKIALVNGDKIELTKLSKGKSLDRAKP